MAEREKENAIQEIIAQQWDDDKCKLLNALWSDKQQKMSSNANLEMYIEISTSKNWIWVLALQHFSTNSWTMRVPSNGRKTSVVS